MFQQDSHHSAQKDGLLAPVALVIAALIALQTVLALTGPAPVTEGLLQGPDSYMRLNRVVQLWQTGAWFDPVYHRIDPPVGHIQHWTRPMDLVLLAGAAVAAPFVGFEAGLYGWAVAVNPVLHIAALFAVLWAAAAIIERRWLWLVPMLFIVQPGIFSAFMVARPDHHGLIVLTVIGFVGASLRLLRTPSRGRVAVAAGVLTALALWISIETLIVVVPAIAVLGLKWLAGSRSNDATPARAIAQLSAAAALVAATALVVEHGPRWLDRAYDTLSLAHTALFALTAILWALLAHMAPGRPARRIVFAVAAAAVGGA
ncbi:MAG: hypothetical protein O7A03_09065, partial [Alphaproteobacteria bacterium]|nr:hypothetical protein [Alphaproteobacteria bacterium]